MTWIVLRHAFNQPFRVEAIDGEVTAQSHEAPVELVFTAASARATGERLLSAAAQIEAENIEGTPWILPPGSA